MSLYYVGIDVIYKKSLLHRKKNYLKVNKMYGWYVSYEIDL